MKAPIVVTIDGPAGSGKSTVARALAAATGIPYLSTGMLYRAVAWIAEKSGVRAEDARGLERMLTDTAFELRPDGNGGFCVLVDGRAVPEIELRGEAIGAAASRFAAIEAVRSRLLDVQRAAARYGLVVEGRDTGSVVFPTATHKFYLDADPAERARRRARELGRDPDDPVTLAEVLARDDRDRQRALSPLSVPLGARSIDTTGRTVDEIVYEMLESLGWIP